ncbi:MAG TPA: hypothetical protein VIW03_07745, partial [Anaeromyxobacter sp.]
VTITAGATADAGTDLVDWNVDTTYEVFGASKTRPHSEGLGGTNAPWRSERKRGAGVRAGPSSLHAGRGPGTSSG